MAAYRRCAKSLLVSLRPDWEGHGDHLFCAESGTLIAKQTERLGAQARLDDGECVFVAAF